MNPVDIDHTKTSQNQKSLEDLISSHKSFILRSASRVCKRFITESDDEWSVALSAFTEAVQQYRQESGGFLPFAELVIRRRLWDYFKMNKKYQNEFPVSQDVFDGDVDEDSPDLPIRLAVQEKISCTETNDIRDEIDAINGVFSQYGFSFFDLTSYSPKAQKTKEACAKAVACLLKSPILLSEMRLSKQLPLKIIEKNTNLPRKILERHRKYIIAATEILSGEYPFLAEYLRPIRKELEK